MKKQTVYIQGMHCKSCEILLEDNIKDIHCVRQVEVDHTKGTAQVSYKGHLDMQQIQSIVENAGYFLGRSRKLPFISTRKEDWNQLSKVAMLLMLLYFLGSWLGIFDLSKNVSTNYASLPVVFLVGLTAGISTCMALVGGLVLGVSATFAKLHPFASVSEKFTPHLLFNVGRIVSFMIFGAAIGWIGSILQLSMSMVGFLTFLVGVSMLFLGLQLVEVFPRLSSWQFTLPKSISRALGLNTAKQATYSHKNAALLGGLTFFLPCGFTQAMQLYAISTGNPVAGALTMGTFALGTAPGLLGIGGLAAAVKGKFARYFFKFAGLAVIGFAIFNMSNGLNLTGIQIPLLSSSVTQAKGTATILGKKTGETTVLQATYSSERGITPSSLTTSIGQPVRLEIKALDNGVGCMSGVALPGLTQQTARLIKGQTVVFEFTPQKKGTYKLVCTSMGMYHGSSITVQ